MTQKIWSGAGWEEKLRQFFENRSVCKLLLVCGRSYDHLELRQGIGALPVTLVRFSDFALNPLYEDVCRGVELFRREGCDGILAVGGGSAIDVAKCIKLYSGMDQKRNYLEQEQADTGVPLAAIPTTAGTGSESTPFAVIYYKGVKQSVSHPSILPDLVVLEPSVLDGLPVYQKKCTMLDALCQGIESWWSVNATEESQVRSRGAVESICANWEAYLLEGSSQARDMIMQASNLAGQAIAFTQTTAPHAMSYKLTSLYGLPHGHAVAICLPEVWEHMLGHMEEVADRRGPDYLRSVFADIARAMGCGTPENAVAWLRELLTVLEIRRPVSGDRARELEILTQSVNPTRLKNNPVRLDSSALRALYERILEDET